jgi:hypothetical protein
MLLDGLFFSSMPTLWANCKDAELCKRCRTWGENTHKMENTERERDSVCLFVCLLACLLAYP